MKSTIVVFISLAILSVSVISAPIEKRYRYGDSYARDIAPVFGMTFAMSSALVGIAYFVWVAQRKFSTKQYKKELDYQWGLVREFEREKWEHEKEMKNLTQLYEEKNGRKENSNDLKIK